MQVCQERDTLEALQADVLAILEVFKATNLAKTLSSLAVPRAKRLELVRQLQGDNIVYLNNLLEVMLQNEREAYLYQVLLRVFIRAG